MKLAVFGGFNDDLAALWKGLEPESEHHVFQTYQWLQCWQEMVGKPALKAEPWIAVISDEDNRARIIFPLAHRRWHGIRILELLGGAQGDYLGPLIHREWLGKARVIRQAWEEICAQLPGHDVRHFVKLPALWTREPNPMLEIWSARLQEHSHSATLPASWEEFQKRLRTKLRGDNKRQRKRLAEIGTLSFEVIDRGGRWEAEAETMIALKRERYRQMGVPDMFSDPMVRQFYFHPPSGDGGPLVHLSTLKLNGETLAAHWGAIYRGRFCYLMPSFAGGKWQPYSAGRLLLESLLEWCIVQRLELFDFTIGGEGYKADWCDDSMPIYEHLRAVRPLGWPYLGYIRIRRWARRQPRLWAAIQSLYGRLKYGRKSTR